LEFSADSDPIYVKEGFAFTSRDFYHGLLAKLFDPSSVNVSSPLRENSTAPQESI